MGRDEALMCNSAQVKGQSVQLSPGCQKNTIIHDIRLCNDTYLVFRIVCRDGCCTRYTIIGVEETCRNLHVEEYSVLLTTFHADIFNINNSAHAFS